MNQQGIEELLAALGSPNIKVEGEWVQAPCPLAFARHKSGRDSNPSFGIHIAEDERSGYHCFSCGLKGHDLSDLLIEVQHYVKMYGHVGVDLAKARAIAAQEDDIGYLTHDWADTLPNKHFEPWPEWYLEGFRPAWAQPPARAYLQGRGMSAATAKALDLRWDSKRRMVVFPVRHQSGFLAGLRGRSIEGKRYHDYTWNGVNNTSVVLYGEGWINPMLPVVVVEGPFDLAAVYSHYQNVVAIFMASVNKKKTATLQAVIEVLVMTDSDLAGEQVFWHLRDVMVDATRVELPEGRKDPGQMTPEEIRLALGQHVILRSIDTA